jgi:hypothetical protein
VALIVVIVVAVVAASSDDDGRDRPESTTSTSQATTTTAATQPATTTSTAPGFATPEDAIRAYLLGEGYEYAGDCATASLDTDIGKWCSAARDPADADDSRQFGVGPTFAEFVEELTVERGGDGQWRVTAATGVPGL